MNIKRVAGILTFLFAPALGVAASSTSDKSDVVDAVHRYLDNLDPDHPDKLRAALAMCDSQVSILDEFPPHEWHGPTACADWWKGLLAYDDKAGITDGDASLGAPLTVDVNGEHAYFVAPMTYTYRQDVKSIKETASFAVALRGAITTPGLLLFRFNAPIVFFNAPYFKREVLAAAGAAGPSLKWLVIDMLPITMIDATGLYTVEEIVDMLKEQGVVLAAVGRQTEWRLWAEAHHRDPQYSKVSLYPTFREAIRMFRRAQGTAGDSEEVSEPI